LRISHNSTCHRSFITSQKFQVWTQDKHRFSNNNIQGKEERLSTATVLNEDENSKLTRKSVKKEESHNLSMPRNGATIYETPTNNSGHYVSLE